MSNNQPTNFVHLHIRTGYSFYQSTIQIKSLIERTRELNMPAVAITDDGSMAGAMECYFKAKKQGIKGIVGATVAVKPDRNTPELEKSSLVLLCENMTGYRNLCRLVSGSNPVNTDYLAKHSSGLIALSGGMYGELNRLCAQGETETATAAAQWYCRQFPCKFYIELHPAFTVRQDDLNKRLRQVASLLSIPLVATAPCHYLNKVDRFSLDVLKRISPRPSHKENDATEFWYMSPEEIGASFPDDHSAVENSQKIAELCQLELDSSTIYLPEYPLPPGRSHDEELRDRALRGLVEHLPDSVTIETTRTYHARLEHELASIKQASFASWFLFMADVVDIAHLSHIQVGTGRGAYPSSLASYCLGISAVDPIRYGLIFERFERFITQASPCFPDFFIDVSKSKRRKLIKLVADRFGRDRVTLPTLFHCLEGRNLMRQTGRILNIADDKVERFVRLCPEYSFFKCGFISSCTRDEKIRTATEEDQELDQLFQVSKILDGLPCMASSLPYEIVVTPSPASDFFPIKRKGGLGIIQYNFGCVQQAGIPTFPLSGWKDLDVIERLVRSKRIDISRIPENDEATFNLIASGDTRGIFQLDSPGMRKLLQRVQPAKLTDIAATTALHRPGPIESGMMEKFIHRKHGLEAESDIEGELAEILGETYGVIVYGEQIMEIAHRLAGYTYQEADSFRRNLQKGIPEQQKAERPAFLEAAKGNGADQQLAESIHDVMAASAEYTFIKSHAIAQTMLSYRAAYLKAHFPEEFSRAGGGHGLPNGSS